MDLKLDNYQALLIVLYAVHHRIRKIPKSLSLDEFYQLAILCNKYDLAEIFLCWVEVWKSKLGKVPGEKMAYGKSFVIAWVFRLSEAFEAVTREMIYDASLSSGFVTEGVVEWRLGASPTGFLVTPPNHNRATITNKWPRIVSRCTEEYGISPPRTCCEGVSPLQVMSGNQG